MILHTKFNIGDTVFFLQKLYSTDKWTVGGPVTIGQITRTHIRSPGIEKANALNYKPYSIDIEEYMCVETGIKSGTFYDVNDIFSSKKEATNRATIENNKLSDNPPT